MNGISVLPTQCTRWEDLDPTMPVVYLVGLRPGDAGRRGKPPPSRAALGGEKEHLSPHALPHPLTQCCRWGWVLLWGQALLLHILSCSRASLSSLSLSCVIDLVTFFPDSLTLFLETLSASRTIPSLAFLLASLAAPFSLLCWGAPDLSTQNSFLLAPYPLPCSSHPALWL